MSAHTPGPWVWLEPQKVLNSAHGKVIDHACYEGMWFAAYDEEINAANARLIAAAPELLEALQGVLRVADRATSEFDAARAAIAKATGETK